MTKSTAFCAENSTWYSDLAVNCGYPDPLAGASVALGSSHLGAVAIHTCLNDTRYVDGTTVKTSVCQENGQWSRSGEMELSCTGIEDLIMVSPCLLLFLACFLS